MYVFLQNLVALFLSKSPAGSFIFSVLFLLLGYAFKAVDKNSPVHIFFYNMCLWFALIAFVCGLWIWFR